MEDLSDDWWRVKMEDWAEGRGQSVLNTAVF